MTYLKNGSHSNGNGNGNSNGNGNGNGSAEKGETNGHKPSYKYVGFEYLKNLTAGKPEGMASMMEAYLEETPKLVNAMKHGIEVKDWKAVASAVHSIIPSFTMVGMDPNYEVIARKIEQYASKKEKLEEIPELFSKIEKVCSLAMEELQQEIARTK